MKKALVMLVCLFALAGSQAVMAENAGVGLEWSIGPQIPFASGFQMQGFQNKFNLSWQVGDSLRYGVFNQSGNLRAKHEYTSDTLPNNPTVTEVLNASVSYSGMDISSSLPGMDFLLLGIDLGVCQVTELSRSYTHSDGTAGANTDFGAAPSTFTGSTPMVGIRGKWVMISSKSKGIWSEIGLNAALRMVSLPDVDALGSQDALMVAANQKRIDTVNNLNSLDLTLGVTIGF